MPTKIDIQPTDQEEESDEDDSDEMDEEVKEIKDESHKLIDHIMDDDDKPKVWGEKQSDQKSKLAELKSKLDKTDEEDYSEDFHSSAVEDKSEEDPYVQHVKRSKEMMDKTDSFKDDSNTWIIILIF